MKIKYSMLIMLLLLVTGCSANDTDDTEINSNDSQIETQSQAEPAQEEEVSQEGPGFEELVGQLEQAPSLVPAYDPLISTDTFINEEGMNGWRDFKELAQEYQLADFGDLDNSEGSHPDDITAFFEGKDQVQIQDYGEAEGSRQVDFQYLSSGSSTDNDGDAVPFFSRIVTIFVDDKLVFASVQPALHSMDPQTAVPFSIVTDQVTSLADLTAVEPRLQVFNVSEMKYKGLPLTNAGVLTESPEETGLEEEPLLVYFTFSPDVSSKEEGASTLVAADTSPFSAASQDFAASSFQSMLSISDYIDQQSQ